jgi:hypothetical protein
MLRARALVSALVLLTSVIAAAPAAATDDLNVTLPGDGSTTEITTTDPAQTVRAHFSAARGQHLILFCDTPTDAGLPNARVLDGKGKQVALGGVGCFRHVMPTPAIEHQDVPVDGPLTLVLPPYQGKAFSVKLSYRAFDDVRAQATVDGGPVAVAPAIKGQDSFVSFEGKAGDRIYATCTSPFPDRGPEALLLDAHGNAVESPSRAEGHCLKGELFRHTPTLPADGVYTVFLDNGWNTNDLSATLTLARTLPNVTVAAPTDGTPFTLTTTGVGQNARAEFTLAEHEHALITCAQRANAPRYTVTYLTVPPAAYSPGESRPCWPTDVAAGTAMLDSELTWVEGPHSLEIDPAGTETGSFDLRVYAVRDTIGMVWAYDRPATITTTKPGQNARFSFYAEEGDQISGTCRLASGTARVTWRDPWGDVVATGDCATPPAATVGYTGYYSATVDWPGLEVNTATISLHRN